MTIPLVVIWTCRVYMYCIYSIYKFLKFKCKRLTSITLVQYIVIVLW